MIRCFTAFFAVVLLVGLSFAQPGFAGDAGSRGTYQGAPLEQAHDTHTSQQTATHGSTEEHTIAVDHEEHGTALHEETEDAHAVSHDEHAVAHDEHGEEHGEHGEGGVMGILAHHLVDAEVYDLPWGGVELPVIPLSIPALGYPNGIPVTKHMIGLTVAAILVLLFLIGGTKASKRGEVPKGFGNFLEVLILFVRDEVVYANLGEKHGRKWLPFYLTAFFLILFANLLGMVPWGTTATGNINMTAGLAITMLFGVIVAGFREHGIKYIGTFIPHGVPILIAPILFPIEIFGLLVKHFALCIRLFANMLAGHTIIAVFIALIMTPWVAFASVPGAVAISMLELFVAFLQAYIFVMLSSLFVGAAIHPH